MSGVPGEAEDPAPSDSPRPPGPVTSDDALDNLPPSTMPADLGVSMRGFADEASARRLGDQLFACVSIVGQLIDLSSLDGITVAYHYDDALAQLDRGLEGLRPLTRTDTVDMQGVAMSPAVMRNDVVKTHIVFNAAYLQPLADDQAPAEARTLAIAIIAHECAHVQITAHKERAIPAARFGTRIDEYERAVMFQVAEICWDEYSACRLSAPFAPGQVEPHAETLAALARDARGRADHAIRQYRTHGDLHRLVDEAGAEICQPLKAAAYLLGSLDGRDGDLEPDWPRLAETRASLQEGDYDHIVDRLHEILRELWATRDEWAPELDTFAPLEALTKAVFDSGGIHFTSGEDGGCHIDVPFSSRTMPGINAN